MPKVNISNFYLFASFCTRYIRRSILTLWSISGRQRCRFSFPCSPPQRQRLHNSAIRLTAWFVPWNDSRRTCPHNHRYGC